MRSIFNDISEYAFWIYQFLKGCVLKMFHNLFSKKPILKTISSLQDQHKLIWKARIARQRAYFWVLSIRSRNLIVIFFKINLLYATGQILTIKANATSRHRIVLHTQVPLQVPALRNISVHRRVKSEYMYLFHFWELRMCMREPIAGRTLSIQTLYFWAYLGHYKTCRRKPT